MSYAEAEQEVERVREALVVDIKVWMYLAYLAISIGLTVWVASTLSRNGLVFLEDVFTDSRLAKAVNHLLVVGFYLLNLGYVSVAMTNDDSIGSVSEAMETLSLKVGLVLLVLGALHFFNLFALNRYRRSRMRQQATHPPLPPAGRLPMGPAGPMPFGGPGGHGFPPAHGTPGAPVPGASGAPVTGGAGGAGGTPAAGRAPAAGGSSGAARPPMTPPPAPALP